MPTKKAPTTKITTTSKKSAKPRTIRVVGEASDDYASENAAADSPDAKANKKSKATPKDKRLSAISAAAKVLTEVNEPMNARQLIDAIVAKGYWTSPAGKTPHATLYSAILREIKAKGSDARFAKADRGKFAAKV
jgi:hypothetical protein